MPIRLDIVSPGAPARQLPLQAQRTRVPVGPGERFRLVGDAGEIPADVRVRRVGDSLVIDGLQGDRELELNNFFGACRPGRECTVSFDGPGAPTAELTQDAAPVAALADGSFLLFGSATNALPAVEAGAAAAGARTGGVSPGQIAAGAAGLLALAAVGGGGGGGGGDPGPTAVSPTPPQTPDPAPTPTPPTTTPPTVPPTTPGDTTAPTLVITDDVAAASTRGPVTFTFRFDEPVTGFTAADVAITNGTAGAFAAAADGRSYTLTVTPNAGVQDQPLGVVVGAGAATDAAGNRSVAASAAQQVDTRAPTLAVADDAPGVANRPVTFTFTFDEPVTGFTASDVLVAGGAVGAFAAAPDGRSYSLVVAPPAGAAGGTITVDVPAGVATDALGNPNGAAARASQSFDTLAPAQRLAAFTVTDDQPPGLGFVANGAITNDRTPTVTLRLDSVLGAGEELVLLRDGARVASAGPGASQLVSTEAAPLASGTRTYTATVIDAAGNATVLDLNGALAGAGYQIGIA